MRTLSMEEMLDVEGGQSKQAKGCSPTLAKVAFGAAVVGMFVPVVGILGWAAVGAWMSKCID